MLVAVNMVRTKKLKILEMGHFMKNPLQRVVKYVSKLFRFRLSCNFDAWVLQKKFTKIPLSEISTFDHFLTVLCYFSNWRFFSKKQILVVFLEIPTRRNKLRIETKTV